MVRGYTTFGVGGSALEAYESTKRRAADDPAAEPVAATDYLHELVVPAGANGSKVGTLVQRAARDEAAIAEAPADVQPAVAEGAALIADPSICLAIKMDGPVGERMKQKLGATDGDAYMLFGLLPE